MTSGPRSDVTSMSTWSSEAVFEMATGSGCEDDGDSGELDGMTSSSSSLKSTWSSEELKSICSLCDVAEGFSVLDERRDMKMTDSDELTSSWPGKSASSSKSSY